jgi:hypothetical protein
MDTDYDSGSIVSLPGLEPSGYRKLISKRPTEWSQDDWYRAIFYADDSVACRHELITVLTQSYPQVPDHVSSVLEYFAWVVSQYHVIQDPPTLT